MAVLEARKKKDSTRRIYGLLGDVVTDLLSYFCDAEKSSGDRTGTARKLCRSNSVPSPSQRWSTRGML